MTDPNTDKLADSLATKLKGSGLDVSPAAVSQIAKAIGEEMQDQFTNGLSSFVDRQGSKDVSVAQLYHQQFTNREKIRDLNAEKTELQRALDEAKAGGSLSDEDSALLAAAKEIGDLGALKTQLAEARQKLQGMEVGERRRKAASVEGYNSDVLAGIAGLSAFDFAVEKVKGDDGKEVDAAFLVEPPKKEGEEPTKHRLTEYMAKHHSAFVPALTSEPNGGAPTKAHPGDKKTKNRGAGGAKALQDEILADIKAQHTGPEDRNKLLAERLGQNPALR